MTPKAKPYSLGWTITVGLITAIAFAMLSLFFLYMQAQDTYHRLTGEVISVHSETVSVQNARGDVIVLVIPAEAGLRGMSAVQELEVGQHVMTRGSFLDDGTFEVDRLRTLTKGAVE
ncbi:MAG: hypothetical protein ABF248_11890 [Yoonia sp.]